jgi:DNA polymerase-3 subunit delta
MIVKSFELKKKLNQNINYFLLYGSNSGLINNVIEKDLIPKFSKNIYQYDEREVLDNVLSFNENLLNKSFFENDKLIIVNRASDKIFNLIEELSEKKIENIKIILKAGVLEKKSKIRKFFEKSNKAIVVPFYEDTLQTITFLIYEFFKEKKIKTTSQIINLIAQKSKNNREILYNELEKISDYALSNQSLDVVKIKKLINIPEDYKVLEVIDNYLLKNMKKTISILNENNFFGDKNIEFVRSFLFSLKRLKNLKVNLQKIKNIDLVLTDFKPPIFWKEKEIIKKQLNSWSLDEIKSMIIRINNLELSIKKNSQISNQIINNFILEKDLANNII